MDAKTMRTLGNHLVLLADSMEKKGGLGSEAVIEKKEKKKKKKEKSETDVMTPEMIRVTTMIEEKNMLKMMKKMKI